MGERFFLRDANTQNASKFSIKRFKKKKKSLSGIRSEFESRLLVCVTLPWKFIMTYNISRCYLCVLSDIVFRLCTIVLSAAVLTRCGRGAFTAAGSRNFRNQHTFHLSRPIQGQDQRHLLSEKKLDPKSHTPSAHTHAHKRLRNGGR